MLTVLALLVTSRGIVQDARDDVQIGLGVRSYIEIGKALSVGGRTVILQADPAGAKVTIRVPKESACLSMYIEAWAGATKADVVMPLIPVADRDVYLDGSSLSLRQIMEGQPEWQVRERDHVLVFRDALSFVDESFECPIVAGLQITATGKMDPRIGPIPGYREDDLRAYAEATKGDEFTWRPRGGPAIGSYHGIDSYYLDTTLVPRLALETVRRAGLPSTHDGNVEEFLLASLSDADIGPLVMASRRTVATMQAYRDDFPEVLRGQRLRVQRYASGLTGVGLAPAKEGIPILNFGRGCMMR